jgi:hypothetical protein
MHACPEAQKGRNLMNRSIFIICLYRPLQVDAADFQHRLDDAASAIQRKFRKRLSAHASEASDDAKENLSETSVESLEATGEKKQTDEEENSEDDDTEDFLTLAFLAVFGVGMLLFKVLSKCVQNADDTGGAENVVPDGNMPPQTGTTQAAPQTAPAPQPPP